MSNNLVECVAKERRQMRTGSTGQVSQALESARLHARSFDHKALADKTRPGLIPAEGVRHGRLLCGSSVFSS